MYKECSHKMEETHLSNLSMGNFSVDPTWSLKVIGIQVPICLLPPRGHCRTLQEERRCITSKCVL